MSAIFVVSDTHFSHHSILNFRDHEGNLLRPDFDSAEEMDEYMIAKWNSVVSPSSKVYHLGDVAIDKRAIALCARLNGHKRLVRGNHDIYPDKYYTPYFESIYGSRVLDGMILTHIPIHPESLGRFAVNLHGHTHSNTKQGHFGPKYYNMCVEHHDYTPLSLEDIKVKVKQFQEAWSEKNHYYDSCDYIIS